MKIFLHLSRKEQTRRFLERIDDADKNWKFSESDMAESAYWDQYQKAYEETIQKTATEFAPWYVVPADNKWFSRVVVAAAIIDTLASFDLAYPQVGEDKLKALAVVKRALSAQ